ncbi:endoplasmic reticulum-Golgi intermediate compartment protein 2-like [Penaeus indicus]|uniref:endoplasmic reticulum-Golgi intermediate compartment protein 2-like n=1 Tax=Penaeus indicus TaxID=29960 RepID=UPI00300C3D7A
MLRRRKTTLQTVKSLDAFPKTSEECVESTPTGGTMSLLSLTVMVWLVVMEIMYYMETSFKFTFKPDTDFSEKLKINVDLTVAMPCKYVGADVLDMTGEQVMTFGELEMEDTWWELDPDQRAHFDGVQRVNSYLRDQFHSIHEFLWRSGYTNIFGDMPPRRRFPQKEKDACRIYGHLGINKVAGNFHITAGKSIPLPRGHAHLAVFMDEQDYNFTHRIDKLSFGDASPGVLHPLEGDEQIAEKNFLTYQYFIMVVPTKVDTYSHRGTTFQYSVAEQHREISHEKNSHGTPGIFFKYDVSALKVEVVERHEPFLEFLTRLCGIVGGIFTCSGLVSRFVGFLVNCFTCRYFMAQKAASTEEETSKQSVVPSASLLQAVNLSPPDAGPQLTSKTTTSTPLLEAPGMGSLMT